MCLTHSVLTVNIIQQLIQYFVIYIYRATNLKPQQGTCVGQIFLEICSQITMKYLGMEKVLQNINTCKKIIQIHFSCLTNRL